jgi:large subunit ribosomal protein L4
MELAVFNNKGEKTERTAILKDEIFSITPNEHAVYLDVNLIRANSRQGTHKVKERNEHSGSTKKIKRQKGTGGARAGSIKNPIYGNGRTFGPRPRDYSFKLNTKLRKLARKSALSEKAKNEMITIVEDFTFESPKTKQGVELLKSFNLTGKKGLLILSNADDNVILSMRNIPGIKTIRAADINTYDVLNAAHLLLTENSIPLIENILS